MKYLVQEVTGAMAEEDIPFSCVVEAKDFQDAMRKASRLTDHAFPYAFNELREWIPNNIWVAADGSSVVVEVRILPEEVK